MRPSTKSPLTGQVILDYLCIYSRSIRVEAVLIVYVMLTLNGRRSWGGGDGMCGFGGEVG